MLAPDRIYADYREMARREAERADGIEAVVITTPNDSHRAVAEAFLNAGVDVICDKPLTTTLDDARALVAAQRRSGVVFGVTHAFAAHAMVRQAREMIAEGALGTLRQVHVEFLQGFSALPPDPTRKGHAWRLDPARVGRSSTTADIGTHAHHLASFVTGLPMTRLRAEFHVCGAAKPLDDTCFMHVRYRGDVPGTLIASQAAIGNYCGLRLRIYGEQGGLEWDQEVPEYLRLTRPDRPDEIISRGRGAGVLPAADHFVRLPRGHPEALTDAWANLYSEFAVAIAARREGTELPEGLLAFPDLTDGVRGVAFVEAAVASHEAGGSWVEIAEA
jgi:predicted dehydrogenase